MSPLATTPHARHYHHLGLDQGAKVVTRPTRPSSTPPDPDTTRSRHDPIPTRHDQDPLRPTTQQNTAKLKSPPNFESDQTTKPAIFIWNAAVLIWNTAIFFGKQPFLSGTQPFHLE